MILLRHRFITTNSKTNINYNTRNEDKNNITVENNKMRDEKEIKLTFLNFSVGIWALFIIGFILRVWHSNFPNTIT